MAQLWGGRFTKQTDQLVFDFNASITFDKRLFHEDVTGSIVHATMLAKQGILTEEERKSIVEGLTGILEDVDDGTLAIDETQEDILHTPFHYLAWGKGEGGKVSFRQVVIICHFSR